MTEIVDFLPLTTALYGCAGLGLCFLADESDRLVACHVYRQVTQFIFFFGLHFQSSLLTGNGLAAILSHYIVLYYQVLAHRDVSCNMDIKDSMGQCDRIVFLV